LFTGVFSLRPSGIVSGFAIKINALNSFDFCIPDGGLAHWSYGESLKLAMSSKAHGMRDKQGIMTNVCICADVLHEPCDT
jgi:hypothetical protein